MVISIAPQKSGTGKTTTAITPAIGLGKSGKKVLLIASVTGVGAPSRSRHIQHPSGRITFAASILLRIGA